MKIFATVVVKDKVRFNELYDLLCSTMSKPTLSLHLNKHLVKKKFIIKHLEDVQKVSYTVNYRKFSDAESVKMNKKIRDLHLRDVADFLNLPFNKQMELAIFTLLSKCLHELRAEIDHALDSGDWRKELALFLWKEKFVLPQEKALIELCRRDEEYRKKLFQKLDEQIEEIDRGLGLTDLKGELDGQI